MLYIAYSIFITSVSDTLSGVLRPVALPDSIYNLTTSDYLSAHFGMTTLPHLPKKKTQLSTGRGTGGANAWQYSGLPHTLSLGPCCGKVGSPPPPPPFNHIFPDQELPPPLWLSLQISFDFLLYMNLQSEKQKWKEEEQTLWEHGYSCRSVR